MRDNINTSTYWDWRFSSGDWQSKNGSSQTTNFAKGQIPFVRLDKDFRGTLLDFGCGLGDALPVYKSAFPHATLIGVDISNAAISICRQKYGDIGTFIAGDYTCVPEVDVIIASNVLEHLDNDAEIASQLMSKCKDLYIFVPYKENPLLPEHVNVYDESSFSGIGRCDSRPFPCKGWTPMGFRELWVGVYLKNIFRFLLTKPLAKRNLQISFHISKVNVS